MLSMQEYFTLADGTKIRDLTDWEKLMSMTDEEIHESAMADPDAQPLTEEELSQMRPFRETELYTRIQRRVQSEKSSSNVRQDSGDSNFFGSIEKDINA